MSRGVKTTLGFFVYAITIAIVCGVLAGVWAMHEWRKPGPLLSAVILNVQSGASLQKISQNLEQLGAVENPKIFELGVIAQQKTGNLRAGEYALSAHMSAKDILNLLINGKTVQRSVTIREGLTSYEIVQLLKSVDDLKQSEIDIPKEGSLLPETYSYTHGDGSVDIIRRMQKDMREAIDELWLKRAENLPFKTKEEAIILASIIEKETGVGDERADVAGVFVNRLRIGMLLQTDPTVIYALTKGAHKNEGQGPLGRRLLRKDLSYDSPYNTYVYAGLPPGPIANPGRASIEAALNPAAHDYLYFVADGSGGHVFGKTLAEHNRNAANWRKIRKEKAQ